jgi:ProP effector
MTADSVSATSPGDPLAERPEVPSLPGAAPVRADAVPDGPALSAEACAELLKQRFPALFSGAPRPLKLRIQADIRERAPGVFSKAVLSAFLRRHTGRTAYLIALTRATHRFDLDGAPADEISVEHRQAARDELARRRALSESREALLEEQRRHRAELLRAFEGSSLSTANFCALKGVPVDELDGLLELARGEAEARARQMPAVDRGRTGRPDRHPRPGRPRG